MSKYKARKLEKEKLLSQIPKVDENGISFTKIQMRNMMKRVKKGLPPLLSQKEEEERLRRIKVEKKREEEELKTLLYDGEEKEKSDDDDSNNDQGDEEEQNDDDNDEDTQSSNPLDVSTDAQDLGEEDVSMEKRENKRAKTNLHQHKKKRTKPVPPDYVCQACLNKNTPPVHWIYDCPNKIHKPGTNQISKKNRGFHDPSSHKVFVSGLPFTAKAKDVEHYFEKEKECGKVVNVKMLTFEDSFRCKGQAFVTFATEQEAKKALTLNGICLESFDDQKQKGKTNKASKSVKSDIGEKKKALKLGVKKVLSRIVTKQK
jgi:hypothetical protein